MRGKGAVSDRGAVLSDIASWLRQHDLHVHAQIFEANDIDVGTLPDLTEQDLLDLGLSVGHRRKLLRAVRSMNAGSGSEAERRQITVLFADIVGYTNLSRRLDPEELLEAMSAYHDVCTRIVGLHGGTVIEYVGDGVVALFGWPVATEYDARSAVLSGLEIQKQIEKLHAVKSGPLQARIGVATGLSLVGDLGREGARVMGDVPNLASRLQSVAEPGQVIVSHTTTRLIDQAIDCTALGPTRLKGFDEPVQVWRAEGIRRNTGTVEDSDLPPVPLVGRAPEMAQLAKAWAGVAQGGQSVVCLRGQAGIGKSRIVKEFTRTISDDARLIHFFAAPDAMQSPLRPVMDEVEALAGFRANDTRQLRLEKLAALVVSAGLDAETFVPIIGDALNLPVTASSGTASLSPERRKATLFEGLGSLIRRAAEAKPVVVVFEDLHWLDPASLEFASSLARVLDGTRAMILATLRPEGSIPWDAEVTGTQILELGRLSGTDAVQLLRLQAGAIGTLDEAATQGILERADGIPLYLEELTKSASESEISPVIPITLQEALMARLDRLGEAKRVTQMAAVIGRDFTANLLGAVLDMSPALVSAPLDRLVDEQILSRDDTGGQEARTYRFRHMLLAEAAYESQLRSKRRTAHGDIADVLQKVFPDKVASSPEFVARHLLAGGRAAEAVQLFRKAGLSAVSRAHYQEAEMLLKSALEALETSISEGSMDPVGARQSRLEILTEIGTALIALRGFGAPEVGDVFVRAEAIGRDIGPGVSLARALWGAFLYQLVSGNLARAEALARELLALGEATRNATGDTGLSVEAHWALGDALFWLAELDDADKFLRESLRLFDGSAHGDHALLFGQDPCVAAHCYRAATCWAQADHAAARQSLRSAFRRAQAIGHPFSTAWALSFAGLIAAWREEPRTALRLSAVALKHTERQIVPFWQSAMTVVQGWARLRCGDVEEGLGMAQAGLAFYEGIGSKTVQPYFRGLVAECLRISGDLDGAEAMIGQAFAQARDSGELISEIWLHIFDARLKVEQGRRHDAEQALRKALSLAREKSAVELELTAAWALDQLAEQNGTASHTRTALVHAPAPERSSAGRRALSLLETTKPI